MDTRKSRRTRGPVAIDSDVLIWHLRGSERATRFLEGIPFTERILPSVVAMELMRGSTDRTQMRRLRRFLDGVFPSVTHVSEEISRRALALVERYALSHQVTVEDALIAATALTIGAPLATANVRDYRFVAGLELAPFKP